MIPVTEKKYTRLIFANTDVLHLLIFWRKKDYLSSLQFQLASWMIVVIALNLHTFKNS